MNTDTKQNSTREHAPQGDKTTGVKPRRLKLGIDVHWAQYTVVAQFDGASPRPAQRFTPGAFVEWVKEHLGDAQEVHSCYEAGAFGYVLHRRLVALGVRNLVVRPRNWDEYGKKQKTFASAQSSSAAAHHFVQENMYKSIKLAPSPSH